MNAVEFIKQDHRQIEELFRSFLDAESESTQEEVFQQIETGLTAHSDMEEQVFYPALQGVAPDEVKEALEEHAEVKQMLADLLDADVNDEDFDSRFQKLMDEVNHHVQEEESSGGILEIATEHLDDDRLSQMADEMRSVQRRIKDDMAA
jgi:hemerythrin superfamily protein